MPSVIFVELLTTFYSRRSTKKKKNTEMRKNILFLHVFSQKLKTNPVFVRCFLLITPSHQSSYRMPTNSCHIDVAPSGSFQTVVRGPWWCFIFSINPPSP